MRLKENQTSNKSDKRVYLASKGKNLSSSLRIGRKEGLSRKELLQKKADKLTTNIENSLGRLKKLASQATTSRSYCWKLIFNI